MADTVSSLTLALLEQALTERPHTLRELMTRLGRSRTTVYHALRVERALEGTVRERKVPKQPGQPGEAHSLFWMEDG